MLSAVTREDIRTDGHAALVIERRLLLKTVREESRSFISGIEAVGSKLGKRWTADVARAHDADGQHDRHNHRNHADDPLGIVVDMFP